MAKKHVRVAPPILGAKKKAVKKIDRKIAGTKSVGSPVSKIDAKLSKKTVSKKDVQDILNDPDVVAALKQRKEIKNASAKKATIVRDTRTPAKEQQSSQSKGDVVADTGREEGTGVQRTVSVRPSSPTPRKKAARPIPTSPKKSKEAVSEEGAGNGGQGGSLATTSHQFPTPKVRPSWLKQSAKKIDYDKPPSNWQTGSPNQIVQVGKWMGEKARHLLLRARAGTGKTFTTVLSVAYAYRDAKIWIPGVGTTSLWGEVKRNLGFDPIPSEQQQAVWDFIAEEQPQTVRYCAFNRSIVKSFSKDYKWLVEALKTIGVELEFSTIHSMGYKLVTSVYPCLRGYKKTKKYKSRDVLSAVWKKDLKEVWEEKATIIKGVEEMVRKIKISLGHVEGVRSDASWARAGYLHVDEREMERLAFHYGIDMGMADCFKDEIFELSKEVLNTGRNDLEQFLMDYEDMVWLPTVNDLRPYRKFDLGLIDEGQDLNKAQQELAFRFMDRIVIVGDDKQAIYGFAGADTLSLGNMKERMDGTERKAEELRLTVTRRCGKKIVALAQEIVPDFEAHEGNHEGSVNSVMGRDKAKEMMADKDMVLCRTNAPIVSLAFSLIREGRQCHIQGRDIAEGLKGIIKSSQKKEVGDFLEWLDKYEQEEVARLQKRRVVDEDVVIALQDKCMCLRIFCEGRFTLYDVYLRIDQLFQVKDENGNYIEEGDEKDPGVKLSSGHRAKGLEAKRVFILRPEKIPHPMAKTAWAKEQEMNLKYVMITRAKEELYWVRTMKKDEEADG